MKANSEPNILRMIWASQNRTIVTTVSIVGCALILIYGLYTYRENWIRRHLMEAEFEQVISDPAAEERVIAIARRFDCVSCDTCKYMPLKSCECRSGKAARNFIRREIFAQSDDSVVVQHVSQVFGGLKDHTRE